MAAPVSSDTKDKVESSQLTAANANRDGTGTVVDLVTGAAYGSVVDSVEITGTGNNVAGVIRFFVYNGAAYRLLDELLIPAVTVGVGTEVFRQTWTPPVPAAIGGFTQVAQLKLPSGWKLAASTHNAETFNLLTKFRDN